MQTETQVPTLQSKLRSLVEWDVLQFLHHNPHTVESAAQIALALGRDADTVRVALDSLARAGLLHPSDVGSTPVYRLAADPALRKEIETFILACDDATFRRSVIERILSATQR